MYEKLKNINILYVEDDEFIREQTCALFSVIFKNVYTANDGEEGIKQFELYANELDIIVTDINMPKVTGIKMSQTIKETYNSNVPIIAVSAYSKNDHAVADIYDIFTYYLRKPIQIKDLIDAIEDVLNNKA